MINITISEVLNIVNSVLVNSVNDNTDKIEKRIPLTGDQIETNFTELNIDSITFIQIIIALESKYEIEIPDEYLLMSEINSVYKLFHVIKSVLDNPNIKEWG